MSLSPPLKLPIPSTLSLSIGYDPSRIPELHCSTPALHTTLLYCKLLLMHLSPDPYLMFGVVTGRMIIDVNISNMIPTHFSVAPDTLCERLSP